MEEGKTLRTVVSASPWTVGDRTVGFEIVGHSFLWNQVRRIAMALHSMELGRLTEDEVHDALTGRKSQWIWGGSAEWLILWDVVWEALPSTQSPDRPLTWQPHPRGRKAPSGPCAVDGALLHRLK